ncbi:hypothetical protein WJX75_002541 [Coccomyxa subellipsoidea]|uniref:Uncharacterized protein n=1 Tax=Coccomyxa subellipsoidea TaxID=248742 RepID=A0ABR2YJ16_9CHLO
MDTKNYLPATKYSVSALYFKFFQLEREVFYILNCLATDGGLCGQWYWTDNKWTCWGFYTKNDLQDNVLMVNMNQ